MMGFMERSAIKLLKKRGNTDAKIARALGRDRKKGTDRNVVMVHP